MRETPFDPREHPERLSSGASVVTNPYEMDDLVQRLQKGDPAQGWEGDPRLVLAFHRAEQRWELWRREHDEQYRLVCRSKPGLPFPGTVISDLVSRDARRGFDVRDYIDRENEKVESTRQHAMSEAFGPMHEKMQWALRKDDNVGAGL